MSNLKRLFAQSLIIAVALITLLTFRACQEEELQPVTVQFSMEQQNVTEGGEVNITLSFDRVVSQDGTIYLSIGGSAVINENYATDHSINNDLLEIDIIKGQKSAQLNIVTVDNDTFEGSKSITFTLKPSEEYQPGTFKSLTITIGDDEDPSIIDDGIALEGLSIAEAKLAITNSNEDDDLIIKIDLISELYTIQFESRDPITIHTKRIEEIEYDSAKWLAILHFQDGTSQATNFLGELNFDMDKIVLNPYLKAPLSALVEIVTPVKGKFKMVVTGKIPNGVAIGKSFDYYGKEHGLTILGLYENYTNQVEFVFMNQNNKPRCSKTLSIPVPAIDNKPDLDIQILKNTQPSNYNGLYMVFNSRLGFDQTGEVRWYYNGEGASFFCKLRNGNFISSKAGNQSFYEVTMLGQLVKEYDVPYGLHHEIVEMPAGNFLIPSHSPPGAPYEDVVVEIDRNSGAVVKSWDFNFILDPQRPTLPDTQPGDWLHINAMYYDETDNSMVVSARSQSAVAKIDLNTGAVKWILGNHTYWNESLQPFLLKPVDANGNEIDVSGIDFWNYGQHAIQKTTNGNILLYDNGDYRGYYDDPTAPPFSYTRFTEYKINEQLKTVKLVWQFDNDKTVFTPFTGYVQELPQTNSRLGAYMWISDNTPKIIELNANDQIIFEATLKQNLATNYYRTYKVDVYSGVN